MMKGAVIAVLLRSNIKTSIFYQSNDQYICMDALFCGFRVWFILLKLGFSPIVRYPIYRGCKI